MPKDQKRLSALERATQQAMGEGRVFGRADDQARELYPELWAWLSTCYVGREQIKTPAVLSLRLGPEGVLVSLVDRDYACSLDVSCPHLADALAAVEAALTGPCPPLKGWGHKEPRLRKRRAD